MKGNNIIHRIAGTVAALALLFSAHQAGGQTAKGAGATGWSTVDVLQTNFVQKFVTNIIEVRAPHNIFVTEYRTNHVPRTLTNVVAVAVTNWSKKTLTNVVAVNRVQTNVIEVTVTNWSTRTLTNLVSLNLYRTNVAQRIETNWITRDITNLQMLTLTNWQTVVVTRTNWVHQPLTNVITMDVPFSTAVLALPTAPQAEPKPTQVSSAAPDALVVEAVKTARPFNGNEVEVRFRVKLSNDPSAPLAGLQCRVERDDSAVLFVAQTQEFNRRLPPGRYIVQATARRDANGPMLSVHSKLDVTRDAVAPAVVANHPAPSVPGR